MLGLRIALSVAKGVIDQIGGLLSKLARRATYSENLADSRAVVSDIDDADVLDKATILLTPTATSDARVHSVKTYTGNELVTNGTFDTDSNWTFSNAGGTHGWRIADGRAICDTNAATKNRNLTSSLSLDNGKSYRLTLDILQSADNINVYVGGTLLSTTLPTGENLGYEYYISSADHSGGALMLYAGSSDLQEIDNVSVVDVSSDFAFDRASSATRINSSGLIQDMQSITDPELVLNGDYEELGAEKVTNGDFSADSNWNQVGSNGWSIDTGTSTLNFTNASSYVFQGISTVSGKSYKVTLDIELNSGTIIVKSFAAQNIITVTSTGRQTLIGYFKEGDSNANFGIQASGSASGKVHSVSVKELDSNDRWTVTNSDADNFVELTEGFARLKFLNTSPVTTFQTSNSILQGGQTYKLVVDVHDVTSGKIKIDGSGISELFDTEGVTTRYITPTGATSLVFYRATADVDITLASVSVKDITFSTDVDLARINYDSNGANGHILLEPTSTNLVTYSEDFSEWSQVASETTDTPNSATSPSGESNATKLQEADSSNSLHRLSKTISLSSATDYSLSIFAKKGTLSNMQLMLLNTSDTKMFSKVFDLENGTLGETLTNGGQSLTDSKIENIGNGWYRCSIVGQLSTTPNSFRINLANASTGNTTSNGMVKYTGDGNGNIFIYGAQLEELSFATSYIPTLTGSTVTRATETLTGSGNSTLINSTEGVLYAEIAALADDGTTRRISLSDGSISNRVSLELDETSNKIKAFISNGGVSQILEYTASDLTQYNKIAIKYKANDFALWLGGVERDTDTLGSVPIGLNTLEFAQGSGGNPFYGKCKALAVFNEALSDTQLTNLTS